MSIGSKITAYSILVIGCLALATYIASNHYRGKNVQLSAKPPESFSAISLEPVTSTVGINLKLPYQNLKTAIEHATATQQSGHGEQQTCKKIIGVKTCATVEWSYQIDRVGEAAVEQHNEFIRLSVPLTVAGKVGVSGKGAKIFGLQNKKINAAIILIADLKLSMQENWCPNVQSDLHYRWTQEPTITLIGKIKINLKKSVDKALSRKLGDIGRELPDVIDCDKFTSLLHQQWRVHSLPLKLPDGTPTFLVLTPQSAHISEARAQDQSLDMSLALNTLAEIKTAPVTTALALPQLGTEHTDAGTVELSVLLRLPYDNLNKLVSKALIETSATDKRFEITSVEVYPSNNRLVFEISFKTKNLSRLVTTEGNLFISAIPVVNTSANLLHFDDIRYTRMVDNKAFELISVVMHQRLLSALEEAATIDLSPHTKKLEQSVVAALSNPAKTGDLSIIVKDPQVQLVTINPEKDDLALIVHLSTALEGTVEETAFIK